MFQKVKDELVSASEKLNIEKVFELAPIYLLPQNEDCSDNIQYSLEQLLSELDSKGIVSEKDGACIRLSAEKGSIDIINSAGFGLYDDYGKFKKTLDQWLQDIGLKYHFYQGIVLLSVKKIKDLILEDVWCEQLFRHIKYYKNHFLFIISFDEKEIKDAESLMGKSFFCETIMPTKKTEKDYNEHITSLLEQYDTKLSEDAAICLTEILKKYYSDINYKIIDLWIKQILWNMLKNSGSDMTLNEIDLSETMLAEIVKSSKSETTGFSIGFITSENKAFFTHYS